MSDTWSPDESSDTEAFEQGDEAQDEAARLDPDFDEALEQDPSLDPALQLDDQELEEAGVELDDPEALVTLDGGMDDPDGNDGASSRSREDESGWDLNAPLTHPSEADEPADE
jgi:hypothetical protein